MRTITVSTSSNVPFEILWSIITDIPQYPRYVKFIRKALLYGPVAAGVRWDDETTILWLPIRMKHTITRLEKYRVLAFDLDLPFGGKMSQVYTFGSSNSETIVVATISFFLGIGILDTIIGPVLERRLRAMLTASFEEVKRAFTVDL